MKMKVGNLIRRAAAILPVVTLMLSVTGCSLAPAVTKESFAMGSILTAKIYASKDKAEAVYENINNAVTQLDSEISATNETSSVAHINETGISKVSPETLLLMTDIVRICRICHKQLDPTIGAVSKLWGFSTDTPGVPDEKELKKALKTVGLDGIRIDNNEFTVGVEEGQQLDLGAFGKGAALDRAYLSVKDDTRPLLVTFGGAVMIKGKNPSAKSWKIGIRDPFGTANDSFATLSFANNDMTEPVFISTSGAYEKNFEENGKTYHHILSAKSGYPAESELAAVTVTGSTGLSTDALSTFCFIQGLNEDTLQTLETFSAEAVFIFNDHSYFVTDGLKNALVLADSTAEEHIYEK